MKKEVCKFANKRMSFIVEALLANSATDGRVFDKLVFIIIERSEENKTIKKVEFFFDLAMAKVLAKKIQLRVTLRRIFSISCLNFLFRGVMKHLEVPIKEDPSKYHEGFKKTPNDRERGIWVSPANVPGKLVSVSIKDGDNKLFFQLDPDESDILSTEILDCIRNYQRCLMAMELSHHHKGFY